MATHTTECLSCGGGTGQPYPCICSTEGGKRLKAQTDELLESLIELVEFTGAHGGPYFKARALITKHKGGPS
jgi:hypothetical protein